MKYYRLAAIGSLLSIIAAMFVYPGSHPFNVSTTHYSLILNTLSDLGLQETYRGDVLIASRILFTISMALAAVATWGFFYSLSKRQTIHLYGGLATLCFLALPYVPSDSILALHNSLFFGVIIFSGIALWMAQGHLKGRVRTDVITLATMLTVYMTFLLVVPPAATSVIIREAHSTTQKLVFFAIFAAVALIPIKDAHHTRS